MTFMIVLQKLKTDYVYAGKARSQAEVISFMKPKLGRRVEYNIVFRIYEKVSQHVVFQFKHKTTNINDIVDTINTLERKTKEICLNKVDTYLKQGHSGDLVEAVQERLGLRSDGVFGPRTRDAVRAYQIMKGLTGDGIVGPMTWKKLDLNPHELEADTDITTGATWIEQHPLPDGEYVKEETAKKWIFIHHTAGRHNPYKVIDQWGRDQRGRIGTHYVIGGLPASGVDETEYDGRILQAFKDEYLGLPFR